MARQSTATNTILYGPPGTGKTFTTFSRAVLCCDGLLPGGGGHDDVAARFEQLRSEGRVTFVTFHQSYGYEEFVEGLRPQISDGGQVSYYVQPGAFKRACESARLRSQVTPGLYGKPLKERSIFKMSLGATSSMESKTVFDYCVKNKCILLGWGKSIDFTECDDKTAIEKELTLQKLEPGLSKSTVQFIDLFKFEMKIGDLVVASHGNKLIRGIAEVVGDYEFVEDAPFHQMRAVKWLAFFDGGRSVDEIYEMEFVQRSLYKLKPEKLKIGSLQALINSQADAGRPRPHVLIIDEINRANISKVLGELITLIEPDKRDGEPNAITLKLPYSGEDFSVPANLHLLGTMNTADRSIALLDTALRRRFDFIEVMPNPHLLKDLNPGGIDLAKLLAALNRRIEALYDRDHMVGHAYFMGVKTQDDLDRVFRLKVLPLLQEYFFENWSKVRRVLNDIGNGDFVQKKIQEQIPADGENDLSEEVSVVYSVNPAPFPVHAYLRIYMGT